MIPKQLERLKFCRIKKGTKKPFEKDWTNKPYTSQEIQQYLPEENYGVLCGYENLAVIDCDNEILQTVVEGIFPKTFRVKTGSGGTHNYFFIPDLKQKVILETEDKIHLGEIQSYGTQVVAPGSIHPNGNIYEVKEDNPIISIGADEIFYSLKNFIKGLEQSEESKREERKEQSAIDDLNVSDIWGTSGLKKHGSEYYGSHPIHGSENGTNFWINPSKNLWHCFRCNSGGGSLSAIAVKEGIIDCSEAQRGSLRGNKAIAAIKIAKEKYGLKEPEPIKSLNDNPPLQIKDEIKFMWDKELKDYVEKDINWRIDRILNNKGIIILGGKQATFKSWISLIVADSISLGIPLFDKFNTSKGNVLYLDRENQFSELKKRQMMVKKGLETEEDLDVGFISESYIKLDIIEDLFKLEQIIKEKNISVLICDVYRRLVGFDENDATNVSFLFVNLLKPLCERTGVSIILLHHEKKGDKGNDEVDALRGSSDLANFVDGIIQIERKGDIITLKQTKNRGAKELLPFSLKIESDETSYFKLKYLGTPEGIETKVAKAITDWIMNNNKSSFSFTEAQTYILSKGYNISGFKNALNLLLNNGVVVKNEGKRGKYEVSKELNLGVWE